jgi:hypothetical protein
MCCKESPRFPNKERTDCIYHVNEGCALMRDHNQIPDGDSPVLLEHTAVDSFILTCKQWPQNSIPILGKTGGCCLQWIKDE